jgi:hypothetical protein
MGLDMYLYAEKYVSKASDSMVERFPEYAEDNAIYDVVDSLIGQGLPTPQFGGMTISRCVGYWRKANGIHGWFVRELADGVDECQRIRVEKDDLIRLRDQCLITLSNRSEATPNAEDSRVINLDEGDGVDDVVKSIADEFMKQGALKNSKTIILDDPLAPTAGFFFGSTDKDEWYYKDVEYTVDMINSLLANDGEWDYYYRASW